MPSEHFDPRSSHVIPALIKKFVDAVESGAPEVEIWGTGEASRGFPYVEDAAEGILLATAQYDSSDAVNLGAGFETKTGDLARKLAGLCGFQGKLRFNPAYPDGQPRRMLDTTRARERFGFVAGTGFDEGLKRTVEWWRARVR